MTHRRSAGAFVAAYRDCDDEKMEEIARVDSLVADTTADALKPCRQLCKRPCFHDEYLQSYNNPNTHLIDTDGRVSPRSRRPVSSWATPTTNSTASFSPPGSRSVRPTPDAPASRRPVATVSPSPALGGRRHAVAARPQCPRLPKSVRGGLLSGSQPDLERAAQPGRSRPNCGRDGEARGRRRRRRSR